MFNYIILGIIQGLTEFFPVSSSAHLLIVQRLLGINHGQLAISVVLHLGTVAALLIFFFKDILKALTDRKLIIFIIIVTLITGIIGLSAKDFFESLFSSTKYAAVALFVTGIVLILTKRFTSGTRKDVNSKDAYILGLAQAVAIIPGISRSGSTISSLLFRGVEKETAFRLSFLVSIPAVFGAAILEAKDISLNLGGDWQNLAIGFFVSLFSGLIALWGLKLILQKAKLYYFGFYCIIVAMITLIFLR